MARLILTLAGPVRVETQSALDVTPKSAKSRALLAILGVEPSMRLARSRAQDLLWSDRAAEQGAASLRQALTEIRRIFGDQRDAVQTGPGWIGLHPDLIQVGLPGQNGRAGNFATDLDVRDPEFEDWIREQRSKFDTSPSFEASAASPVGSLIVPGKEPPDSVNPLRILIPSSDAEADPIAGMALSQAAHRVDEFFPTEISFNSLDYQQKPDFVLRCRVIQAQERIILSPSLVDAKTDLQLWSQVVPVSMNQIETGLGAIAEMVCSAVFSNACIDPALNGAKLPDFFGFSEERLLKLDDRLARFDGTNAQSARIGALRGYIRYTMLLERCAADPVQTLSEATVFSRMALEAAPNNTIVQSIAALIQSYCGDHDLAIQISTRSEQGNRWSSFVQSSLSSCLAGIGRPELAFEKGLAAQEGGLADIGAATYAVRNASSAIRLGKEPEALQFAKMAHHLASDCRPALRFMAALQFRAGDYEGTVDTLKRLKAFEPDFSLQLMADESYPIASLRAANFLEVTKSGLL